MVFFIFILLSSTIILINLLNLLFKLFQVVFFLIVAIIQLNYIRLSFFNIDIAWLLVNNTYNRSFYISALCYIQEILTLIL